MEELKTAELVKESRFQRAISAAQAARMCETAQELAAYSDGESMSLEWLSLQQECAAIAYDRLARLADEEESATRRSAAFIAATPGATSSESPLRP
jgi:hypothetical protein